MKDFVGQVRGLIVGYVVTRLIQILDGGGYTHSGLVNGALLRDARKRPPVPNEDGELEPVAAVVTRCLTELGERSRIYVAYADDSQDLAEVWDATLTPTGDVPAYFDAKPEDFAFLGMLRVAILLKTRRGGVLRKIGNRLMARYFPDENGDGDDDGMFCSEFVAKAFVYAELPLEVRVDRNRLPDGWEVDAWAQITAWRELVSLGAEDGVNREVVQERARAQIESLAAIVMAEGETDDLPVGTGEGTFPAWLVTPADLAPAGPSDSRGSPSLTLLES